MRSIKTRFTFIFLLPLSLALFTLFIHLVTCTNYQLHRDEMLYMAMGRHLSLGYMSTPPMMGFLAYLVQLVGGSAEWMVKLLPALSGSACVFVIALFVQELGGRSLAVLIGCLAFIVSPAFLHTGNLFIPVAFDEFFWLLLTYFTLRLINTADEKYWLRWGLVCGIAFLNKYSIIFFAASILVALLLSEHRKALLSKYFIYGLLIALLIASPNLVWQAQHHFPVVTHMAELQRIQLANENPLVFLTGQLEMNLPCLFIWLGGLLSILLLKSEKKLRFFGVSYIVVCILLMLGRGKGYYALGAYPMLFAIGGYEMEKYLTGKLIWLNYVCIALSIAVSALILPLALPVLPLKQMEDYCKLSSKFLGNWVTRWEDGTYHAIPQTYADMTGWKELSNLVVTAYGKLESTEQKRCLIFTRNYGQAGAILFYGKPYGLPEPVSFNDAFLFWAPEKVNNTSLIYVSRNPGPIDSLFNIYREFATVHDPYFRENGLHIYICREPKPGWPAWYHEQVMKKKAEFNART